MKTNYAPCEQSPQDKPVDASILSHRLMQEATPISVAGMLKSAVEKHSEHKACAWRAGYAPDYWSRVLTNDRGILLDRLATLPLETQREFLMQWGRCLGLRFERKNNRARMEAAAKLAEAAALLLSDEV